MSIYLNLGRLSKESFPSPRIIYKFRRRLVFHGEVLLASRPTPNIEDNFLSAARDCLFNIFADTVHSRDLLLYPYPEDVLCRALP
jgi:hypothetical protein